MQATAFKGLDVHAGQTHAGILDARTGELHRRRLRGEPVRAVIPFLEGLGPSVRAVYEAGATGFALARAAAERGLDLQVCAPGLIPKKPSDRVKTDARDAERLARLLAAGELSFVRVPAVAEEQVRDLVRAREDVRCDLNRARQRLSHFLRRRGLGFPGPGKAWTRAHRSWLRSLAFADLASRATFADYLSSVDALGQRRDTLDRVLAEVAPESPWGQMIERTALLSRDRPARRRRPLRRGGRLRALRAAEPALGLSGPRAVRAHLRREASTGADHQGRAQALPSPARRGGQARLAPTGGL